MNSKKFNKRLTLNKSTISNLNEEKMYSLKGGTDTDGPTVCAPGCITDLPVSCGPVSLCICPKTYFVCN